MSKHNDDTPRRIVITGSGSGIGLGLAEVFLAQGHQVMLSDVDDSHRPLRDADDAIHWCPCDVTRQDQLQVLWDLARQQFGAVDLWINNAGTDSPQVPMAQSDPVDAARVMDVNVVGVMLGTGVALNGMSRQDGGGMIFNLSGFGGNGYTRPCMAIYGCSKRAVAYFSQSMAKELGEGPVRIGWINPGMVISAMVVRQAKEMDPELWRQGRRVFNWFGETVADTARRLAPRILASRRQGDHIHLLPMSKILRRLITAPLTGRDILAEYGI